MRGSRSLSKLVGSVGSKHVERGGALPEVMDGVGSRHSDPRTPFFCIVLESRQPGDGASPSPGTS